MIAIKKTFGSITDTVGNNMLYDFLNFFLSYFFPKKVTKTLDEKTHSV